jgi:hypothetical protein
MDNITVLVGPPISPEIVIEPRQMLRLLCPRGQVSSWLRNGEVASSSGILTTSSEGIYQCVGELSFVGQDETLFTGEPGSNVYILTQGTYMQMIIILYEKMSCELIFLMIRCELTYNHS